MRVGVIVMLISLVLILAACSGGANGDEGASSADRSVRESSSTEIAPAEEDVESSEPDNERTTEGDDFTEVEEPATTADPDGDESAEQPEAAEDPVTDEGLLAIDWSSDHGLNLPSLEWECVQNGQAFDPGLLESLDAIAGLPEVTVIRLPMNQSCWNEDVSTRVHTLAEDDSVQTVQGTYRGAVELLIQELDSRGWSVIFDLHWSAPNGQLAREQALLPDEGSIVFWGSIAEEYGQDERVVAFELHNEPVWAFEYNEESEPSLIELNWDCWLNGCITEEGWQSVGMQQLVDTVREAGAQQDLIVNGLQYANDMRGWLDHAPTDPLGLVVAGFHTYDINRCDDQACWSSEIGPILAEYPVVITEFGDLIAGSDATCSDVFNQQLIDWVRANGVGYTGWGWFPGDCGFPSLISSWDGTFTPQGAVVCRDLGGAECPVQDTSPPQITETESSVGTVCEVSFRVESGQPMEASCTNGATITPIGSDLTGWNGKLSSYQSTGEWDIEATWEVWEEVFEGEWEVTGSGTEDWSAPGEASYGGTPQNDRFQHLLITINGPGSLVVYSGDFGGANVVFEVNE